MDIRSKAENKEFEILIADDDEATRKLLSRILENNGYGVCLAENGVVAVQKVRDKAPDLILLDVKMPAMDGFETCSAIKSDKQFADIPILFISGSNAKIDKIKGFEVGGVDYIAKPFEPTEVLARVHAHLRLHELTEKLELEVWKRTAELADINVKLQQELEERKRIEKEIMKTKDNLTQEKKRLVAVMEALPAGIAVLDADGRIVTANASFDGIWGKSRPSVTSIKDADQYKAWWMDTDIRLKAEDWVSSLAIRTGKAVIGQMIEIERFDGIHAFIVNSAVPIFNENNQIAGCAVALMDISERKRLEMEKIAFESKYRLIQKTESLKRMAAAIAHRFNNLLQTVIGNIELSISDLPKGHFVNQKLNDAMSAVTKAAEISKLMLVYLGHNYGEKEIFDLADICRQRLLSIKMSMPKHIDIKSDLLSPGPVVQASKQQMGQVLSILATNAWEACNEKSGVIHLTVKTISHANIPLKNRFPVDWVPLDMRYAVLEVADSGCGITEKDIENLFDPFFSSKFTGRGLGLPVALGILRSYQGAITVESTPGRGSVFKAFLPLSQDKINHQPESVDHMGEIQAAGSILVVDDEPMVLEMTKFMLTKSGYRTFKAKSGLEALEIFRQHKDEIRCVICDVVMPKMDGWETLKALREILSDIPVILSSGYDKSEVLAGDHPEWPQAFLEKPYRIKALCETIEQVLSALAKSK